MSLAQEVAPGSKLRLSAQQLRSCCSLAPLDAALLDVVFTVTGGHLLALTTAGVNRDVECIGVVKDDNDNKCIYKGLI